MGKKVNQSDSGERFANSSGLFRKWPWVVCCYSCILASKSVFSCSVSSWSMCGKVKTARGGSNAKTHHAR